jgi:hypothetical protein
MLTRIARRSLTGSRWHAHESIKTCQLIKSLSTQSIQPPSSLTTKSPPRTISKVTTIPGSSPSHPRDIAKAKPFDRARILHSYEDLRTQTYEPVEKTEAPIVHSPPHESVAKLLPLLKSQPPLYTQINIHGRPYLVTVGDTIRLPFLMPNVAVGDVLRMNKATLIGSRDYSLKAPPVMKGQPQKYLDENLFVCRVRVVGETQEPLRVKEKTKRRRRHIKHIWSKHKYTVLRVTELDVINPPSPVERLVEQQ